MNSSPLTLVDLKSFVPAAFATSAAPGVSSRYEFIPTLPLVENLLDRGWQLRSARQSHKTAGRDFASHQIVFDVPGAPTKYAVGDVHPTATLYTSHNRTRKLSFVVGFFVTLCSNQAQACVTSHNIDRIHILGYHGVDFSKICAAVVYEAGEMTKWFERMKNFQLEGDMRDRFGRQCLAVKHYLDPKYAHLYTREQSAAILTPLREAQRGEDLWLAFNVAQENLTARVNEVTKNREVNLKLWELSQGWCA
jgi:Domain of unknown function (DUF932).